MPYIVTIIDTIKTFYLLFSLVSSFSFYRANYSHAMDLDLESRKKDHSTSTYLCNPGRDRETGSKGSRLWSSNTQKICFYKHHLLPNGDTFCKKGNSTRHVDNMLLRSKCHSRRSIFAFCPLTSALRRSFSKFC